jgi:hypothetical protein
VSSAEENGALARRFLVAQAKADLDTLEELMAPDFVDRSVLPGQGSSREDYKHSVLEMDAAFSNVSFTVESQISEGELVAQQVYGQKRPHRRVLGCGSHRRRDDLHGHDVPSCSRGQDCRGVE